MSTIRSLDESRNIAQRIISESEMDYEIIFDILDKEFHNIYKNMNHMINKYVDENQDLLIMLDDTSNNSCALKPTYIDLFSTFIKHDDGIIHRLLFANEIENPYIYRLYKQNNNIRLWIYKKPCMYRFII